MSDETSNTTPPVEGAAPAPAAQTATAPAEMFTRADVEAILAAERQERAASDPVARFKATATKKPEPAPAAQSNALSEQLSQLIALQVASLKPPAPPAPPKQMSTSEKLASADADIFLRRGANAWTASDTSALAADIARARGIGLDEAHTLARRQVVERATDIAGRVKVTVGGPDPFAALTGGRK